MSSPSFKERYMNLNNGERFLIVTSAVFTVLTVLSFFVIVVIYNIIITNQNTMNENAVAYDYGNLYTFSDCFSCSSTGCGTLKTTPCLVFTKEVQVKNPVAQNTFYNTPINLNNLILFSKSNQQNTNVDLGTSSWFSRQTKILPSEPLPYVYLDGYLITNNLNTLSIGYFDYDSTTNKTSVCDIFNAEGAFYFSIDKYNATNKYMCICVNNPSNPAYITAKEYCKLAS